MIIMRDFNAKGVLGKMEKTYFESLEVEREIQEVKVSKEER